MLGFGLRDDSLEERPVRLADKHLSHPPYADLAKWLRAYWANGIVGPQMELDREKAPRPESVLQLLEPLTDPWRRAALELRIHRQSYEHIMGKWPVRAYRAVKKVLLDLAGARQRTGGASDSCHSLRAPAAPASAARRVSHAGQSRIAVTKYGYQPPREPFVRAHIEHLPAQVVQWDDSVLTELADEQRMAPQTFLWRLLFEATPCRLASNVRHRMAILGRRRYFRERGIKAVLAEYGPTGVRWTDYCGEAGIPLVVHFHGYDCYRESVLERYAQRYEQMFQRCAAVVAVSRDMVQQLVGLGAPLEKVHYNPYGVDCARFCPTDPARNGPLFLGVGRFVDKKAPHLTILAFRDVLREFPGARLRIVGDGPLLAACCDLVREMGLAGSVELPGRIPHSQVPLELGHARAFVQHSVRAPDGDSEGTPNTILEAGAAGLPVVSTRHAGICDVVAEGETGLLVDEYDVAGMAQHMITLAREPELAARLGRAARGRICARFGLEKSISRLWEIISSAIHGSSGGSGG